MSKRGKRKGSKRDAQGRFVSSKSRTKSTVRPIRDSRGRFVSKSKVRTDYVREIEALRREVEALKREGKAREKDIERNYKRRGGAFDRYVETLALGQRAKIEKYLDDVYDGNVSKEDFITLAVATGLTVREAWAVLYS